MFPEGTRQRKGLVKRHQPKSHTGAARIALEAGVPLVPAGIRGTDELARAGAWRVRYGEPVRLDDLGELEPAEAARVATERVMAAIRELEESL
jgi:1-acyl-sn-glycerol-3-phosphate acyltransferase